MLSICRDALNRAVDGFGALWLFNDDTKEGILPNRMHPHTDMEVADLVLAFVQHYI